MGFAEYKSVDEMPEAQNVNLVGGKVIQEALGLISDSFPIEGETLSETKSYTHQTKTFIKERTK